MLSFLQSQLDNETLNPSTGVSGLPDYYPKPDFEDMLFYIQRNQNTNTVIYQLNRGLDGFVQLNNPIYAFWVRYNDTQEIQELNSIQAHLAYGIDHHIINNHTIDFYFKAYPSLKLFLTRNEDTSDYRVVTNISDTSSVITNIYVYAEEFGVFPSVKYIDLYGYDIHNKNKTFERLLID